MKQYISTVLTGIFLFVFPALLIAQDDFYHPELEWHTIETKHFFVNFHDGEERTARAIAKIAEDIYGPVTTLYNHEPDQKVSFVVKDYDDYSNGAAYFFDNKIEIWASSLDFDLRGTHNWLRNVITHEFTHVVQIQTSLKFGRKVPAIYFQWLGYENERRTDVLYGYPNKVVSYPISGYVIPSWFAEGVAQFNRHELGYDNWDTHRDMILRMYAIDNNMLTWDEMSVFGKTSLGNESSYNAGFAFVKYISGRYGDDKLEKISQNLASLTEVTIDGAIEHAVGKNGKDLYDEWRQFLRDDYTARTESIKNSLAAGDIIGRVGFGNFYPTFSPDGKSIAYVSNKEADYFGLSSIYLYDVAAKTEKALKSGVRSELSWSPDGKKIYYSKLSRKNPHWSNIFDLYVYDIPNDDEKRLTEGVRANSPAVSPDGSTVAFVAESDGTINLFTCDANGKNIRQLTHYANGEQVYNPKWSPDGKNIIFDYSLKEGRDIAMISASSIDTSSGSVRFILATPADERNAVFTPDGKSILFSSDKSGIFNIYKMNLQTGETVQLTNVLGGAFMPSVNDSGQIAFASYTSTGYKIALLTQPRVLGNPPVYAEMKKMEVVPDMKIASADPVNKIPQFDWVKLRHYDDTSLPMDSIVDNKSLFTSLTFIPFLRVDNYNPKNSGLDIIKPGLYMFSYDMLDRYGFFAGAAANKRGERDLFFTFDFRGRIPGLYQLGYEPQLSLEAYNLTRKTNAAFGLGVDTIGVDVTYSLLEFDVALKSKLITEALETEFRFAHSRYTAIIGTFQLPAANYQVVQASSQEYLVGNDFSLSLDFDGIAPSRTEEINPIGRKLKFRYDYEFSKFDPNGEYEVSGGLIVPKYDRPRFHRFEGSWIEHQPLPGWKHTLSAQLRGGTIPGPKVDDFFNFYIGGLAGMKGYPFYSLGGNQFAYANLTYRFPLLEHIDLRVAQIYFDKLYMAFFGDAGNTWKFGYSENLNMGNPIKRDAGIELRLESFSYYSYPTRIFFDATYGFDKFDRVITIDNVPTAFTYGKEWNFHFGVLFGFDLD
ncbi:MAG: biopolymer transporter Tol [Bacteroidota bacterium]